MADIIKHAEFEDTYDDPGHPIPSLTYLEVCTILKNGGAELHIVIAKPLGADEYSLTRLLDKIEAYLGYIRSDDFKQQAGEPSPENTTIIVDIHPESSDEAFNLLEKSVSWVYDNGAALTVKVLDNVQ
jgi:carbamate kinase